MKDSWQVKTEVIGENLAPSKLNANSPETNNALELRKRWLTALRIGQSHQITYSFLVGRLILFTPSDRANFISSYEIHKLKVLKCGAG